MFYYFNLRYRIFLRTMEGYKQHPLVVFIGGVCAYFFGFRSLFHNFSYAPYLLLVFQLFVVVLLSRRERNEFLFLTYKQKRYRHLRLVENGLASLPFLLFLLFYKCFLLAGVSILMGVSAALIRVRKYGWGVVMPTPFSRRPYEFTTGFRRAFFIIAGLYALFFYFLLAGKLFFMLACLYGLYLICITFYSQMPVIFFVWIFNGSAKQYLRHKMFTAIGYSFLLAAPLLLPLFIFHFPDVLLIFLVVGIGIMQLLLAIVYCYANFPIYTTLSQNVQFAAGLFLPPLWFAVFPNLYFQAIRRLKEVLIC